MSLNRVFYFIKYLLRIPSSYGFGVQSPSAFYFIKYVINEKLPYYSYYDLANQINGLSDRTINLFQLYFRITNYLQPFTWIDFVQNSEKQLPEYIKSACHSIRILTSSDLPNIRSFDIARINEDDYNLFELLVQMANPHSLIIIENIYRSHEMTSFWKSIIDNERVSVTFDLLDCGLIFFDNRNKKHYKLLLR